MLNDLSLRLIVAQKFHRIPPVITMAVLEKLLGSQIIDTDTFNRWAYFNAYTAMNEVFNGFEIFTLEPMDYPEAYNILRKT